MADPPWGDASSALLERDDELRVVERHLRRSRQGHGAMLVVEGQAGLGKTAFLDRVGRRAHELSFAVDAACATEFEETLGFGVVRQLLEPCVRALDDAGRQRAFEGAAELALPIVTSATAPDPSSRFAVLHGLYWLLVHLSRSAPTLLLVDDAQWADEPSREWLQYLLSRIGDLPILVVLARRVDRRAGDAEPEIDPAEDLRVHRVSLSPLSVDSVGELIARRLGRAPAPAISTACHQVTGGNPLLVREFLDGIAARGDAIDELAVNDLTTYTSESLVRRTRRRVARLGPEPTRAANALAVLGDASHLRDVAAVADLDLQNAERAVDALAVAGLVELHRPARFLHPLLRAALVESLAPYERSSLHARAADALAGTNADPESIALHLLACEPAARTDRVSVLRQAATIAIRRGTPASAARYLRRALLEPPDREERVTVLRALAEAELRGGEPSAVEHLEEALSRCDNARERAAIGHALANAYLFRGSWDDAVVRFRAARAAIGDDDPDLATRIEADLLTTTVLDDRTPPIERHGIKREDIRARAATASGRPSALTLTLLLVLRCDCDGVSDLVHLALADGEFLDRETADAMAAVHAVDALVFVDRLDDALALAREMVADGQRRASVLGVVAGLAHCCLAQYRLGDLASAEADGRAAFDLAREHGLAFTFPFIASYLSVTLLAAGDAEGARDVIDSGGPDAATAHTVAVPTFLEARGAVRVACDERDAGISDLWACGEAAERLGITNPNTHGWRAELASALALDDPVEAERIAREGLELAETTGSDRAMGIALREVSRFLRPPERIVMLRSSVARLEASPARLELARSLFELGALQRSHGSRVEAKTSLLRSLQLATECGASELAKRVLDEAHQAGARPRRAWLTGQAALTPAERRVAMLAAEGHTNQEIAQSLFVTTKTVKTHLGSAYRKLSISRRTELRDHL